jgi:hypothetical protein
MKTAEEWAVIFSDETTQYEMASLFREIQLDAMKEGMRRAADKVVIWQGDNQQANECKQTILVVAENLTEKDL